MSFNSYWLYFRKCPKTTYLDSIKKFQDNYIATHEVVTGNDRKMLSFFPASIKYRVRATFEKITDSEGFLMQTSGKTSERYFKYGKLTLTVNDTVLHLYLYQSQQLQNIAAYKNYLFLPFIDETSGLESYGSGRYIDLLTTDIQNNNTIIIDFNKCYNPYCAYVIGYNCPVPPSENNIAVEIKAGEKNFAKHIH